MCEKCLDVAAIRLRWLGGDYEDMVSATQSSADYESRRYAVRMECGRVVNYTHCVPRHHNPNPSKRTAYRISEETNKKATKEEIANKVATRLYKPLVKDIEEVKTTGWNVLKQKAPNTTCVVDEEGFIQY